jgi:hypothetical protein
MVITPLCFVNLMKRTSNNAQNGRKRSRAVARDHFLWIPAALICELMTICHARIIAHSGKSAIIQ